uniref:HRDC domain-containing protein n=1 Tax=Grammatophora oceanica TaxID=210454 RepID=A0A6U5PZT7_9STRA
MDLWNSNKVESYTKNETYTRIMKLSKSTDPTGNINTNNTILWTDANGALLKELIQWRKQVALKEECLPGMVCSMDLLVCMAWKRPTNESNLRRILYFLPPLLENVEDKSKKNMKALLFLIQSAVDRQQESLLEGLLPPLSTTTTTTTSSRSGAATAGTTTPRSSSSAARSFDSILQSRDVEKTRAHKRRWKSALRTTALVAAGATAVFVGMSMARKSGPKR